MVSKAKMQSTPEGGPGWHRMRARLGGAGMEALRQDTIARKEAALAQAGGADGVRTDRAGYTDYPRPARAPSPARRRLLEASATEAGLEAAAIAPGAQRRLADALLAEGLIAEVAAGVYFLTRAGREALSTRGSK